MGAGDHGGALFGLLADGFAKFYPRDGVHTLAGSSRISSRG